MRGGVDKRGFDRVGDLLIKSKDKDKTDSFVVRLPNILQNKQ